MIRALFVTSALAGMVVLAGVAWAQIDPLNPDAPRPAAPPPKPAPNAGIGTPAARSGLPGTVFQNYVAGLGYSRQIFAREGLWEFRYRRDAKTDTSEVGHICMNQAIQQKVDYIRFHWINFRKSLCTETTTKTAQGFDVTYFCPSYEYAPLAHPRLRVMARVEPELVVIDVIEDYIDPQGRLLMHTTERDGYYRPATADAPKPMTSGFEHRYVGPTCPADLKIGWGRLPGDYQFKVHKMGEKVAEWAR